MIERELEGQGLLPLPTCSACSGELLSWLPVEPGTVSPAWSISHQHRDPRGYREY